MNFFQSCSVATWRYSTKERLKSIEQDMDGHPPRTSGRLSSALGLDGPYSQEKFLKSGSGLYKLPGDRHFTDLNFHSNRIRNEKSRTFTAGYEALFTPPKSWSVAHAYGDESTKKIIMECLVGANNKLLQELEKRAGVIIQKNDRSEFHSSPKINATTFIHDSNRLGDSTIHFHNYISRAVLNPISNQLQGSGLSTQLMREAELLIGAIARQELVRLAKERNLAVELVKKIDKNGQIDLVPELAGIPKTLMDVHSGSSKRINNTLEARGQNLKTASRKSAVLANKINRPQKLARSKEEVRARNEELLELAGLKKDFVIDIYTGIKHGTKTIREPAEIVNQRTAYTHYQNANEVLDAALASITETSSVIKSKSDLIQVGLKQCNYVYESQDLIDALDTKITTGEVLFRFPEEVRQGAYFWADGKRKTEAFSLTTKMVVEQELQTDQLYANAIDTRLPVSTVSKVQEAIKEIEKSFQENLTPEQILEGKGRLTAGQEDMLYTIMLSTDAIVCIEGWAGSGKTTSAAGVQLISDNSLRDSTKELVTASKALLSVASKNGFNVVGIAPSNQAKLALIAAGISTGTMQALVRDGAIVKKSWENINEKTVIIADESSMWGTVDFNAIVDEAIKRKARIAFIGDRSQIQSVNRGSPFAQIADAAEEIGRKVTLSQEQRSKTLEAKEAHYFGRTDQLKALAVLRSAGAIYEGKSSEQHSYIVSEFMKMSEDERYITPVVVDTNKERRAITKQLRQALYENTITFATQEIYSFNKPELLNYANFEEGFIITMRNRSNEFKAQEKLTVLGIEQNKLIVQRENQTTTLFDPAIHGLKIQSVGVLDEMSTSVGEPIRFTANTTTLDGKQIVNGDRARITAIDKERKVFSATLIDWNGKKGDSFEISYAGKNTILNLRNGFASTIHSLQGATISKGFYILTNTSREAFHTAITRFRGVLGEWRTGIKILCKKVDSKLEAAITKSTAKLAAMPKEKISKIAKTNSFVLPSAASDFKLRINNEIRVPKAVETNNELIAEKLQEFKHRFGDHVLIAGSPEFIARAVAVAASKNLQMTFKNDVEIVAKVEVPQIQKQEAVVAVAVASPQLQQQVEAKIKVQHQQEEGLDLGL